MKPIMLLAIVALTAIVITASFGLQIDSTMPLQIPEAMQSRALYVCPAESNIWTQVSVAMHSIIRYLTIAFFFCVMLVTFFWGWELYQSLVEDTFKRDKFAKPWKLTKFLFWAGAIILLLLFTPNHYKTVHIEGASGDWVLCENNTPGAKAVRSDLVHR